MEDDKTEQKSEIIEGKHSARTLSDIVSISDYDEQDLQMRRAELKHNQSIQPVFNDPNNTYLNTDFPKKLHLTSLIENIPENITQNTPRADSLPINLTSTGNKQPKNYKRNVNEMTMFGTFDKFGDNIKHSTAQKIPDNNSMYPNKDVSADKSVSIEPRRIDFSLEPSHDNRSNEEEITSLNELGIILTLNKQNFPDILSQLKHEVKKSRSELNNCKSELKQAEEQLCEFPALKEEVEKLKTLLENTMATMATDKKFYENQLENFTSNKALLEQRLTEVTKDVNEKCKDIHLLKEDILTRENMILDLAKEKRNLTAKYTELEIKINELETRNKNLTKYESECKQLQEKMCNFHKLELLLSEKNQQIDSLNQHLDRVDDLQRCLQDKTEEYENLKDAFEEKSNEIFQLQDTIDALNRDLVNAHDENAKLIISNKDLRQKLTKLEKEQENCSIKLQSNETEVARLNTINKELTNKLEDLKDLIDKLKDKECEIEILNEDINYFHEEIATLKEQLKMVSRSPSPKSNKNNEEKTQSEQRSSNDKKQLVIIKKQISLLQHELDFHKKELNDKVGDLDRTSCNGLY